MSDDQAFAGTRMSRRSLMAAGAASALMLGTGQRALAQDNATSLVAEADMTAKGPVVLETAKGQVKLPAVPQKLAVLDTAAIDTLAALDVTMAGIATPVYSEVLEQEVADIPSVGTMFDPDYEKLAILKPDLIITGLRAASHDAELSRIATVADMSIGDDAVKDGLARLKAYGDLFGQQVQAQSLGDLLQAKLDAATDMVASDGGKMMLLMTNGPKISAFGPGSRFGWIFNHLKWQSAVDGLEASRHGEPVSFEYVAKANPDTILVVDRGATVNQGTQPAQQTLNNALVQGTTAWKSKRVIYLSTPEAYVSAGGIQSLMLTVDQITGALKGADS